MESAQYEKLLGTVLSERYELLEVVGSGGMSVVFKARHLVLGTTVCVKVLRGQLFGNAGGMPRLKREAKALASLEHPNILRAIAFDSDGDKIFLVTEFLDGIDLAQLLKREPISQERLLLLFEQLLNALEYAHKQGLVHRDLKPSNILVTSKNGIETVKILDFGVAKMLQDDSFQKLTKSGSILGTPYYMAPEQCTAGGVDPRSDIYSLGCILYECLTGETPFLGDSAMEVMMHHVKDTAPIPAGALGQVIAKAMAKNPADRFQTAATFLQSLREASEANSTTPPGAIPRSSRKTQHRIGKALMVCSALVLGAAVAGELMLLKPNASQKRTQLSLPPHDENTSDPRSTPEIYRYLSINRNSDIPCRDPEYRKAVAALFTRIEDDPWLASEACQFQGRIIQCYSPLTAGPWFDKSRDLALAMRKINTWAAVELAFNHRAAEPDQSESIFQQELGRCPGFHSDPEEVVYPLLKNCASFMSYRKRYDEADRYFAEALKTFPRQSNTGYAITLLARTDALLDANTPDSKRRALSMITEWQKKYAATAPSASTLVVDVAREMYNARVRGDAHDLQLLLQDPVLTENKPEVTLLRGWIAYGMAQHSLSKQNYSTAVKWAQMAKDNLAKVNERWYGERAELILSLASEHSTIAH